MAWDRKQTRAPASRATGNLGRAPPPVPPPSPARRKTISTPSSCLARASFSCSIALRAMEFSTCTHAASQCPPDGHLAIGNGISQGTGIDIDNEMLDPVKIIEAKPSTSEIPAPPTPMILARMAGFSLTGEYSGFCSKMSSWLIMGMGLGR